ncbi:helix-turn-helix domain-containing protein [Halomonas stenophila]|uniref:Excisionase family DNA binding protein n=1 Tax=Halomonas stenophila TaxID=795312 RepID=A0A7W5EUE5_9GAMM|nr:helix-turn-helix domain-containing protein [Halomonas stenophila]MBB3230955.1 excisionase family DNA binding protein [Halomonas stenophila]
MKLLTTQQAAEFLGLSPNTVNQWRYLKRGPRFRKIGKNVRYAEADLLEFLEKQTRTGTSHQGFQSY